LKTIKACIEKYENPQASVVPHTVKIWNSLKYEVRNGEVKETIDATLEVLRVIARKLDGTKTHKLDVSLLRGYIDLVSRDCGDDLTNPTYTKQAGLLLMTVISANIRAYLLYNASFIDTIRQNLRQPKSPSHTRDLLLLLNSLLKTRMELLKNRKEGHPDDEESLRSESRTHLDTLFHDVYLPIWTARGKEPITEEKDVLKQVIQGIALLVSQQVLQADGEAVLRCSGSVCSEICSLLTTTLTNGLTLSSNDTQADDIAVEDEAVLGLRNIVMNYTDGYAEFASRANAEIRKRDWANPSEYSLQALKDLLSRLTFIGCSEIPSRIGTDTLSQQQFSPLQHFITSTASLLELFPLSSQNTSPGPTGETEGSPANSHVISSLHASILWFRDACEAKYGQKALTSHSSSEQSWIDEFCNLPEDWLLQIHRGSGTPDAALGSLEESDPEVYRQFLKLALFAVRYLYRSASSGPQESWSERALVQLSQTAALVVRNLDEKLQVSCNLAHEAFNFFNTSDEPAVQRDSSGLVSGLLTLGILQGLRPGAMSGLVCFYVQVSRNMADTNLQYKPSGVAEQFMCDASNFSASSPRESDVRAAIGIILANKYKGGPLTSDSESLVMKRVFDFWGNWMKEATTSAPMDLDTFHAAITVAVNIIAGAAARQDKNVLNLVPALHQAAASQHANGEIVAKSMGLIVKDNDLLSSENHAVVKRFYKQWAYSHLAKPLLQDAQPAAKDTHAATRYRVVILSVISNCPFTVYQDDLEPLIRLLITALTNRTGLSSEVAWTQVVSALEILVAILSNEPDALKGHLREIIGGATKVYQECSQKDTTATQPATRNTCRKLALQVLGAIPTMFEERHVLRFSPPTQRMLAVACGDPVRKVREVARKARANWAKLEV
jgi:DNA repair/transcription protein MET18/MMS19